MLPENLDTAVSVNGVYLLARNLQSMLGHYSVNLFVWSHHDSLKVSLWGSATPILYRGQFFVLITRHQIKEVDPEDVCMLTEDGEFAVTSTGYSALGCAPEGMQHDLQDIVLFNFNIACAEHPSLRCRFFEIREFPPNCISDAVVAVLSYGYPSTDQLYELYDDNHIGSRRRAITLNVHRQPQNETLLHLKPLQKLTFDPDGLSGGPNFMILQLGKEAKAYFAGVTVRAGRDDLYIVKSSHIKRLMDAAINLWG